MTHARGLSAWCSAHAPAWAYPIARAPLDPQVRARAAPTPETPEPFVGAPVLYCVPSGPSRGAMRPGVVAEVLPPAPGAWLAVGLFVMFGPNDGLAPASTSAGYSAEPLEGHWSWR